MRRYADVINALSNSVTNQNSPDEALILLGHAQLESGDAATATLGLLYVSRWSNADKAAEFAAIYAQSLKQRYKKVEQVGETAAENAAQNSEPAELKGRRAWTTDEGAVVIEEQGDTVFVSESLDAATTATLEKEVFAPSPAAK